MKGRAAIMLMVQYIAVLASCSIKEDRIDCPCWLSVDLENTRIKHPDITHRDVTIAMWSTELIRREKVDAEDDGGYPNYRRSVPKGEVLLSAYSGRQKMIAENRSLVIEKGRQCDSVYAYSNIVDCTDEFAYDSAILHKEFATVFITMSCNPDEQYTFGICVRGNVKGFDTADMKPLEGDFEFRAFGSGNNGNVFSVRVPRQTDNSLKLDILGGEGVERTIDIGCLIEDAGYSWESQDLDDVRIDIEHAEIVGNLQILPWEEELREFKL